MIEKSNFNNMAMSNPFYDFSKKQKFQKSCFTGGFQQWKKDNFTFLKSLNFFFSFLTPQRPTVWIFEENESCSRILSKIKIHS